MASKSTELCKGIISTCIEMTALGINQGTSGNVSTRVDDGFLITPSGVPYAEMEPKFVVRMDMNGNHDTAVTPSSEWRMHLAIYREYPRANAVIHTHGIFCTALACQHLSIPAFHYMVAVAGGNDIRCADYATFGTKELADNMLPVLADRRACLLANHGMICYGGSLKQALWLAVEVETLARQYWYTRQLGEPALLSNEEIDRVLARFERYGQSSIS